MKRFIVITPEGKTFSPNGKEVENSQVIGIIENVKSEDEALKKILKEKSWIFDAEFNIAEFSFYEIL